jgi:hypothetical protein
LGVSASPPVYPQKVRSLSRVGAKLQKELPPVAFGSAPTSLPLWRAFALPHAQLAPAVPCDSLGYENCYFLYNKTIFIVLEFLLTAGHSISLSHNLPIEPFHNFTGYFFNPNSLSSEIEAVT